MRPAIRPVSASWASSGCARRSLLDQSRSTKRKRPSFAFVSAPPRDAGLHCWGALTLPPAPEDEPSGCADASRQQEARAERADRYHREVRTQLGSEVRRLADLFAKRLSRAGKLFPLRLDVAANLLECPVVATGHRVSTPQSSALPRGSPAREPEATPS